MRNGLLILGVCVLLLSFGDAKAQSTTIIYSTNADVAVAPTVDSNFIINSISATGDKRTRRQTVLRELYFKTGEHYYFIDLIDRIIKSQQQLMNTNLFRRVVIDLYKDSSKQNVDIHILVEEKWYFFPQPFVRIANGTFSQWNERGRRLDHLNYGIKLSQHNFSGRGDRLSVQFAGGYTRRMSLQYQGFYFDKALKWAGNFNISRGKNREINYLTENNKALAVKTPDGFLLESFNTSFDLIYRPVIRTRQLFSIGYAYTRIGDTVRKLNENYATDDNAFRSAYLGYSISFTDYDFNPYPTSGRYGEVGLSKTGFGGPLNVWHLSAKGIRFWPLSSKTYLSLRLGGVLKLPFKQPYIMQQFLGYGDAYLQGMENYIIDGVAGGYAKQTIGHNIINTEIPLPNKKWFKSLRSIPLRVFVKAYTNQGYSHNPNEGFTNFLNNKMLYSGGFGIDIILFTDTIFKLEWSFNQLGQNGLYLHQ